MKTRALYLRTIVFGVIDSLVSTVGLLAGIDVAGAPHSTLALTGVVYAFVEAFSMAVGSFLSEQSVEEDYIGGEIKDSGPFNAGLIMFLSFIVASFIPIIPYIIFGSTIALYVSIGFSILALFVVGMISAKKTKVNILKHGLKMVFLGGMAIVIGIIVGKFLKIR